MRKATRYFSMPLCCAIIVAVAGLMAGCGGISKFQKSGASSATASKKGQPTAVYSDFGDVLVPTALTVDNESSYVVQTPGFATGVLAMKGRVKRNSLIEFFDHNMVKDNWQIVTLFKSPQTHTIMLFHKENRWCVISIRERDFNTYVQIGVAPTLTDGGVATEAGLLK